MFKTFRNYLRKAKEIVKKDAEFLRDIRRIEADNLDYGALQRIVNSATNNVEIKLILKDGTVIFISPIESKKEPVSFREKWELFNTNYKR